MEKSLYNLLADSEENVVIGDQYEVREYILQASDFITVVACKTEKGNQVLYNIKVFSPNVSAKAQNEFDLLKKLEIISSNDYSHIVRIIEKFDDRGCCCLVTEQSYPLTTLCNSSFSIEKIRQITVQILASLCLTRYYKIVHSNVQFSSIFCTAGKEECYYKLGNFHDASSVGDVAADIDHTIVPEVVYGIENKSNIDMWSLGCLIAQLYLGTPLFENVDSPKKVLCQTIYDIFDGPKEGSVYDSSETFKKFVPNKAKKHKSLSTLFESELLRFLEGFFQLDPEKRFTPFQAITHPYLFPVFFNPFRSLIVKDEDALELAKTMLKEEHDRKKDELKSQLEFMQAEKKKQLEVMSKEIMRDNTRRLEERKQLFLLELQRDQSSFEHKLISMKKAHEDEKEELNKHYRSRKEQQQKEFDEVKNEIQGEIHGRIQIHEEKVVYLKETMTKLRQSQTDLKDLIKKKQDEQTKLKKKRGADQSQLEEQVKKQKQKEMKSKIIGMEKQQRSISIASKPDSPFTNPVNLVDSSSDEY